MKSPTVCAPEVWIIRHADKAPSGGLSPRGFRRAGHLAALVANGTWPRFTQLFAVNSHTRDHMVREVQTLLPMAGAQCPFELGAPGLPCLFIMLTTPSRRSPLQRRHRRDFCQRSGSRAGAGGKGCSVGVVRCCTCRLGALPDARAGDVAQLFGMGMSPMLD